MKQQHRLLNGMQATMTPLPLRGISPKGAEKL
jgi:hypothetical protein